ncbi:hypothetical protein INS49_003160 [Diaporthe citri]|uniref:uncharacterized protein n=1 Tax=Diaporthe citri TaxID=83186 RepID=UPI001C8035BA|nr:uncharacterized protein INS49_003160 [Diaporthe citri]KAG6368942.1 hypothetical protein INS49_003160 [Diaporthe citri]
MFASVVLTTLAAAGSAHAAVAQGSWGVRADYSRCDSTTPLEVVLDGATSKSSPAANITDFDIPAPFGGSLVIKVAGSVGLGSPYPPQQVGVEIFAEAAGGDPGAWGNATITPGTGQPASISQISWNTRDDITLAPAENEEVSLETIFDGGSLVVYYCGVPEAGGPVA